MLKPLDTQIKIKPILGFDTETYSDKNKFIMGSLAGRNFKKVFWDAEKFCRYLCSEDNIIRKHWIAATNLYFDIFNLFKDTPYMDNLRPIMRKGRLLGVKIRQDSGKYVSCTDTMNFAPFSVEKWGRILNLPKLEKPYFLGKYPKTEEEKRYLETYNIRDSFISYKALDFLQNNFNSLGARLKLTVASTSMDLYKRKYMKDIYHMPQRTQLIEHLKGLYGGRTEAIKRGLIKNLKYYDVNSLYPSVMVRSYPHPNSMIETDKITLKTIDRYEGIAYADVTAPDLYIPYLPFRTKDKLIFPKGRFSGYYTFYEIRKALDLGYSFEFKHGWLYTKTFYPFKEYVEDLYKKRLDMQKHGDPSEIVIKLAMNSLYGKWAQNFQDNEDIRRVDDVAIRDLKNADIGFNIGGWVIMGQKEGRIPDFCNPIFSAYTTAYARDRLYSLICKAKQRFYYCDTDSLITSHEYETSKRMGGLKLEYTIGKGIIIRPKMYIIDGDIRCKGVSNIDQDMFNMILSHKRVYVDKFTKFKESLKRGFSFNEKITVPKSLSLEDTKRSWKEAFDPNMTQDSEALSV